MFQLGTALSIYGCSKFADENVAVAAADMELGTTYIARGAVAKSSLDNEHDDTREIAGFWGYLLQIIYQVREVSTPPNCLKNYPLGNLFMFLMERDICTVH